MSSNVPDRFTVTPSAGHIAWGTELAVPRYSQEIHAGHYPEYDGGGEAWCSPTSTEMVVEYWGRGRRPRPTRPGWTRRYPDPTVNHAARMTYDYQYDGAGNWPFNTAYAASFPGLEGEGDPAALPGRAGALHRRRHPRGDQPVLPRQRAGRRRLRHLRAPDGGGRLHRRPAT